MYCKNLILKIAVLLTERAIAAAEQIKFEPKKANGLQVSVSQLVDYSFAIY